MLIAAKECLVASLSSEYETKNVVSLFKDAIDHFSWKVVSASYMPLLTALSGTVTLQVSIALVKNNLDIKLREQLIELCVNAVCREKKFWGEQCQFKQTILPLAVNLCKMDWHALNKSKDLFLATCLAKGAEKPVFLAVLIKNVIADTQARIKNTGKNGRD